MAHFYLSEVGYTLLWHCSWFFGASNSNWLDFMQNITQGSSKVRLKNPGQLQLFNCVCCLYCLSKICLHLIAERRAREYTTHPTPPIKNHGYGHDVDCLFFFFRIKNMEFDLLDRFWKPGKKCKKWQNRPGKKWKTIRKLLRAICSSHLPQHDISNFLCPSHILTSWFHSKIALFRLSISSFVFLSGYGHYTVFVVKVEELCLCFYSKALLFETRHATKRLRKVNFTDPFDNNLLSFMTYRPDKRRVRMTFEPGSFNPRIEILTTLPPRSLGMCSRMLKSNPTILQEQFNQTTFCSINRRTGKYFTTKTPNLLLAGYIIYRDYSQLIISMHVVFRLSFKGTLHSLAALISKIVVFKMSLKILNELEKNSKNQELLFDICIMDWEFFCFSWLGIAAMVSLMGPILFGIHRFSYYYKINDQTSKSKGLCSFGNCSWYIFGAMVNQGGIHLPAADSGRLAVAFWWIFQIITVTTYSGNLVAFLTFPKQENPFDNIANLRSSNLKWASIKQSSLEFLGAQAKEGILKEIYTTSKFYEKNDESKVISNVRNQKEVFFYDRVKLLIEQANDYDRNGHCGLEPSTTILSENPIGLAVPAHSPSLKLLNTEIRKMLQGGLVDKWKRKYWPGENACTMKKTAEIDSNRTVTLSQIYGSYYVLAIGFGAGIIMLLAEYVSKKYRNKTNRVQSIDIRQELAIENMTRVHF
ncbi:Ionotropic receptor 93a [Nymphon striatum]|nr:Ionotropic receptor 93a [Nymphon striatum]